MPRIEYRGKSLNAPVGANLREVLLENEESPYNGNARWVNCRGLGTCGTCAVEVTGPVSPMTNVERWRLGFPPHQPDSGLRLACQCRIEGDLTVTKHPGFWGQRVPAR
ncbi:MAG TPA: 2Fe-2S iron-sulfur cluster-binding protein [Kiritimatiellia bacterium]|nr:2Fe-2S iron-sulfur cluster-binding protein [Kiritimatiellia bacterium]HMP97261.1 2Fe-2S iron-sulfur cluster-binding protein [Kiritimatiellia bacterium]